ncbi:uncharacterized protein LOC125013048 [Tachysurus ichikawai]
MSSGGRKSLVWDIRKSLLTLTAEELLWVARAVNPVSDVDQSELVERDQEECYKRLVHVQALASHEELSKKLIQCMPAHALPSQTHTPSSSVLLTQPDRNPSGEQASHLAREGMVSLRELSYLSRREFKVQGRQIGDQSSDISYNNVCRQIDDGIK